ncbi:MAG TPA: hypothetical protein VMB81_09215 [Candidatus Sulfotelmatobacter sp.]|nr:hypothetical protein [Candidatus Sulfotelmatobacter sp.]
MDDAADLARQCATALLFGLDLETVWHTILRLHPLVANAARRSDRGASAVFPLTTGHRLVVDAAGRVTLS